MKYSYNWLKELSGTKKTPEKVVEDLTFHSFEVEGLEKGGFEISGVVVGKIIEIRKHSNADKLQLVKVDVGTDVLDIVCGAWNIKAGDKVPVALVGTKLPNGMVIREAEIRGEKSYGMLCAEDEVGLGKDHSGIIILPENAKIGDQTSKYFGSDDSILEIKVLPDRAHDAMSYVGVAREISLLEKRKMKYDFDGLVLPRKKSRKLKIEVKDGRLCPRYIGAVMENIKIKESPEWMKKRLEASGIRAINNVVDATNYVMLELGNPLHAFDGEKIKGAGNEKISIVVRKAKEGEKMTLLDESELIFSDQNLLITNGETPLALAGIMGGKDSGISKNTRTLVLESANFNAVNIRKSRTRLNIKTESSDRFEKEIDPNIAEKAMVRLIEILEHTADGKIEGILDVYPKKERLKKIGLKIDYIGRLLGENIPKKSILNILNLVGIKTKSRKKSIDCIVPTYRVDLKTQEDLIEEIGRIWGYGKIKASPIFEANRPSRVNEQIFFERKVQDTLINFGFDEIYNYSFYSEQDAKKCGLEKIKHFELENPMNPGQKFIRASLIPNLLKNINENQKHFSVFRIFEIGRVYYPGSNNVAKESRILNFVQVFDKNKDNRSFFEAKGALEDILDSLQIKNISFKKEIHPEHLAQHGFSAEILSNGEIIGKIGEINPIVLENYKIKKNIMMCELDLEKLLDFSAKERRYVSIRKFPTIIRDISLLDKSDYAVAEISDFMKKTGGNLVLDVELFDIFQKDSKRSLAFHVEFGKDDRTLESREVDEAMENMIKGLEHQLKLSIRK